MDKLGLIIFVKAPIAGEVKTRLAADIGNEKALEVYWQLLETTKKVALHLAIDKLIWSNKGWADNESFWPEESFECHLQEGFELGEKMSNALEFHFKQGYTKLLLIGSDCPEISTDILQEAINSLDQNDLVIGPAIDGGYYLIGMKKLHPELFNEMKWSHAKVLEQTIQKAKANALRYHLLKALSDIDNLSDLNFLSNESKSTNN